MRIWISVLFSLALWAQQVGWGENEERASAPGKAACPQKARFTGSCPAYAGSYHLLAHDLASSSVVQQIFPEPLLYQARGAKMSKSRGVSGLIDSRTLKPHKTFHLLQC